MADEIDLGTALDTIVATIAGEFQAFKTVASEDQAPRDLPVPAILLQLSELEPEAEKDPHTGQFPCLVHVEARLIMGNRTPRVRRDSIKAAGALAAFVHNNRLGVKWGAAEVLAVEPDEFAPQADNFNIWRLEWVHFACVGSSYFIDSGVTPTQVLASWAPDIGSDNEADYKDVRNDV
ncbi:hypothetical protein [Ruegeria sp. A3M17]|uniref:hypothetical protein n=1 Tax=Ruegeria sp. A3M17 TaxID=2267229 RepID=UPI000DE8F217|nr:hypothetical protein [Ruegeria sp. A3M17]RBW63034.1 hypothetical protein DS906_01045 [Ruegeria sp. A3M17]